MENFHDPPEGVIKYRLDYRPTTPHLRRQHTELNAWRSVLHHLGLIGQDASRYAGLAYGNISFRLDDTSQFVITGSQTGGLENLTDAHYCTILSADPSQNHISAEGPVPPSSEALTHAAVYAASRAVRAIVHVHCPVIWRHHQSLGLATTASDIPYGTPAMAEAVLTLFTSDSFKGLPLFVMLGHEDGIVAFGPSIAEASLAVIRTLAEALQLQA